MRVAVTSAAFAAAFDRGLTQLEWIERVAGELPVDGIAVEAARFPRTDDEYVAQVRKIAVDLGLEVVALDAPAFLDPDADDGAREGLVALAAALGAPLLRCALTAPGEVPPATFARAVVAAKAAAKAAKRRNVTVAIEPRAGTLGATLAGVRRLVKDVDSAWLRYAVPLAEIDRDALGPRDRVVLAVCALDADPADAARRHAGARAPIVLDGDGGETPFARSAAAAASLRAALAAEPVSRA